MKWQRRGSPACTGDAEPMLLAMVPERLSTEIYRSINGRIPDSERGDGTFAVAGDPSLVVGRLPSGPS